MGLNIMLPFEQSANPFIDGDPKLVTLKYFFTRKLMFVKECSAVVCCPGGFGTLDETLEVLTLLQTGKQSLFPLVLLDEPGGNYWTAVEEFFKTELLSNGWISSEDIHLYKVTDNVDDAVREVLSFYRVYHSMRYVNDLLVIRISSEVTPAKLTSLWWAPSNSDRRYLKKRANRSLQICRVWSFTSIENTLVDCVR
jgi:hypothetical protein